MNLHLGADVRQTDGEKLGELQGIVYDTDGKRVMALVVQHAGAGERDILVTIRAISDEDADGEAVYLDLTREQFERMRPYDAETTNLAAPPFADNVTSDLVHDPVDVPDVPPVGAATGIESIAFTPIVVEVTNLREGDVVIGRSTMVVGTDGDVGHVARVFLDDETSNITSLVAERGLVFTHDVEIPFDRVVSVDAETVQVSAARRDLEAHS